MDGGAERERERRGEERRGEERRGEERRGEERRGEERRGEERRGEERREEKRREENRGQPNCKSLQPKSDGLQPPSHGLQPKSHGLQPTSDGLHPSSDRMSEQQTQHTGSKPPCGNTTCRTVPGAKFIFWPVGLCLSKQRSRCELSQTKKNVADGWHLLGHSEHPIFVLACLGCSQRDLYFLSHSIFVLSTSSGKLGHALCELINFVFVIQTV